MGGSRPAPRQIKKKKASLPTWAGQPGLGPGLTGTSTRSEAEILAGWRPDPWTSGLASKPWEFMHFRASAIHGRKPLCFTYKLSVILRHAKKKLKRLGIHRGFRIGIPGCVFALKPNRKSTLLEEPKFHEIRDKH